VIIKNKLAVVAKKLLAQAKRSRGGILVLNLLVIAILANSLTRFFNPRLDFTENKIHSLSPATKTVLSQLDDLVTIKAFISEQLPPQLSPVKENLVWFLDNYQKTSQGKVRVDYLDPITDKNAEKLASQFNVPPIQFSNLEKDKFQVTNGYLSLVITYEDKVQPITSLQDLPNLEYNLTSAIKKIISQDEIVVAFSSGHNETAPENTTFITQVLSQVYRQETVNLSEEGLEETEFNPEIDVLVINGPAREFGPKAKAVIDKIIQKQVGILFLIDQFSVAQGLFPVQLKVGLDDLLAHYGFNLQQNLILDPAAAMAGFRSEQGSFITLYPFWPKITPQGFNQDIPVTASLESLVLPWVSQIKLDNEAQALASTSSRSWQQASPTNLAPNQPFTPDEENRGPFVVAAIQTKPVEPFFEETPKGESVRMAVVADADFVKNDHLNNNPENASFFLNLIDFLAQDDQLIAIRSKPIISRPIKPLEENQKQLVKGINLGSPIVITLALWAGVNLWRKKKSALPA